MREREIVRERGMNPKCSGRDCISSQNLSQLLPHGCSIKGSLNTSIQISIAEPSDMWRLFLPHPQSTSSNATAKSLDFYTQC